MEKRILIRAGLKRHCAAVAALALLMMLTALAVCGVMTVSQSARLYVSSETARLGMGDMTLWISGAGDGAALAGEAAGVDGVQYVRTQQIIFSEYEVDEHESDSEGQLIAHDPQNYPYNRLTDDLSGYAEMPQAIAPGEIYAGAAMRSMFDLDVGDTIVFPIARSGGKVRFTVAGYFEDPLMGSTMTGMKSFLIGQSDYDAITKMIADAGSNGLARRGQMLHVKTARPMTAAELSRAILENTGIGAHLEFSHSSDVLAGFMLTLHNVFSGLMAAFALVLLAVTLVVLGHAIGAGIEQDAANMGALMAVGADSRLLRGVQLGVYICGIVPGLALGMALARPVSAAMLAMTADTTGLLTPARVPVGLCVLALAAMLAVLCGFILLRTAKIARMKPIAAMQGERRTAAKSCATPISGKALALSLAVRQVASGAKRYAGVLLTALLLTLFASMTGRIASWLGPNGEGLMDAFNPADLHIAAQPMGDTPMSEIDAVIMQYSGIADRYALAMPNVSVNGVNMTANVITQPERFHMLAGGTCMDEDEIVITEFVAADMGVTVGDNVTVAGPRGEGEYTITGIYQCANDMGANIGMSREGYLRIGEDRPQIWCEHYFIAEPGRQGEIMAALDETFGGDVYLHENSWPGLYGILAAMDALTMAEYLLTAVFVLVVTMLTGGKLLLRERRDLCICRAMGMSCMQLRVSFALRFVITGVLGAMLGTAAGAMLTDPLAGYLMRLYGISNFSSHPGALALLMPGAAVTAMFAVCGFIASAGIKHADLGGLIAGE